MSTEVITKTDGEIISDSLDKIAASLSADFEQSLVVGLSSALHLCADGINGLAARNGDATDHLACSVADLATAIQVGFANLADAVRSASKESNHDR